MGFSTDWDSQFLNPDFANLLQCRAFLDSREFGQKNPPFSYATYLPWASSHFPQISPGYFISGMQDPSEPHSTCSWPFPFSKIPDTAEDNIGIIATRIWAILSLCSQAFRHSDFSDFQGAPNYWLGRGQLWRLLACWECSMLEPLHFSSRIFP